MAYTRENNLEVKSERAANKILITRNPHSSYVISNFWWKRPFFSLLNIFVPNEMRKNMGIRYEIICDLMKYFYIKVYYSFISSYAVETNFFF